MRKPTVPKEYHSMIYDMWKEGITRKEIGKQFKVHENVIWHIVEKQNGGTASQRKTDNLPTREDLMQTYIEENLSRKDVSALYGITVSVLQRLLKEYDISKISCEQKNIKKPADDELYIDYILDDMTQREVGLKYGVSESTISKWLKAAELSKR